MARKADIRGSVEYDVTFDADDGIARLMSAVEGVTATIDVAFKKSQARAALKTATQGLTAQVDVAFSKAQIRRDLKAKAVGATVKANVDFSKTQVRTALKEATAGVHVRLDIDSDDLSTKVAKVVAKTEKAITETHAREAEKRKTLDKRLDVEREIAEIRRSERIKILNRQRNDAILRIDRQDALIKERINAQLNARLEAQNNQHRLREQFAADAERRRIERLHSKPIVQQVLIKGDRVSNAFRDFDRTITRGLALSLFAFTAWSAGVEAAVAGAAAAAVKSFAEVEVAATQTASVVAAQQISDEIVKQGRAVSDFSSIVTGSFDKIVDRADEIALETLFDTKDIVGGIDAAVKAGLDLDGALKSAAASANFAQVNQLQAAEASELLASGLAAAGIDAAKSADLIDKISFVAANALGNANDYLEAFSNRAAASARAFGYTNDEVLLFLDLLGQTGTLGREAGTQANIVFRELGRAAGRASEAWKKYGIDANAPLAEQLVRLGAVAEETRKLKGRAGVAGLAQELGLTYRSISSILQVLPQVNKLGLQGLRNLERGIAHSQGLTDKQAQQVKKTIAFQWDNLLNTVSKSARGFAARLQPELSGFFDIFGGNNGLIVKSQRRLDEFGDRFGKVIDDASEFVQSPAFIAGVETLVNAVEITLEGVADAFQEFSAAFDDGAEAKSTFEAIADSVEAFAETSATVLPAAARIIGEILDTIVDHADAFETFAKLAIAIYAVNKAWTLAVKPGLVVADLLLTTIARYTATATSATAAAAAVDALTAAEVANARAATAQAGASILGVVPNFPGRGFFRNQNRATAIGDKGRAGAAALGEGAAVGDAALQAKNAAVFERMTEGMVKAAPAATTLSKTLGKLSIVVTLVLSAFDLAVGAVQGFDDAWDKMAKSRKDDEDFKAGIDGIATAFRLVGDAIEWVSDKLREKGAEWGSRIAVQVFQIISGIGKVIRFVKAIPGAIEDAFNAVVSELGDAFASVFRGVADVAASMGRLPGGGKFREWAAELRGAADEADAWGEQVDDAADAVDRITQKPIAKWLYDTRTETYRLNQQWVRTSKIFKSNAGVVADSVKEAAQSIFDNIPGATNLLKRFNDAVIATAQARAFANTTFNLTHDAEGNERALTPESQVDVFNKATIAAAEVRAQMLGLMAPANQAAEAVGRATGRNRPAGAGGAAGSSSEAPAAREIRQVATAAEQASAAVDRLTGKQLEQRALAVIGKATGAAAAGYKATRVEAEVLRRVLPSLEKELESQRSAVAKLDQALQDLQSTQIAGTRQFSDQQFGIEQQVKALQLQRVDLVIAGESEQGSAIEAIDEQIQALQLQAERVSLSESLQLDPLRRQLEQTFQPLNELPFDEIMKRVKELQGQRAPLTDAIAGGENLKAVLEKTIGDAEQRFETAGKQVSAGLARGVIAGSKDLTAAGKKGGDALLLGLDQRMQFGSPSKVTYQRGLWTVQGLQQGMQAGAPALNAASTAIGDGVMDSFLAGLKGGFGTPEDVGTVAWYLNKFIPDWIRQNKGPLAYDAQILVPAGHAVMDGFGKGLRDGFGQIQGFVKDVGPSLSEFISADAFSGRTAKVMADIAIGKKPDIDEVFGDLRPMMLGGDFSGILDPTLSFLHRTLSSADTYEMAQHLAKLFGTPISDFMRPPGTLTTSGFVSDHTFGTAVDLSNGSQPTPQMDALYAAIHPLLGKIFKQILYRTNVGGNHFNHVHAAWLMGNGFSMNSGKKGVGGFDIPGVGGAVEQAINAAAQRVGISPMLLAALAKAESGFNPRAGSPAGAQGLTQLMPATARSLGVRNIWDPFDNALGGAKYLKQQLDHFGGNVRLALAAYNAGPGNAQLALGSFSETIAYVRRIFDFLRDFGGAREMGGPVSAGKTYLVGEKGPELWTPSRAGAIVDAATTGRIMAGNQQGASGPVLHDNRTINVTTAATDPDVVAEKIDEKTRRKFTGVNFR